jgi:PIN domain nuclease of toxin-antitoxin system
LRNTLEDTDNTLVVSAASAWEIATKWRLGKLHPAGPVVENYAMALHRLAAQAHADDLVLASTDPAFALFEGVVTLG